MRLLSKLLLCQIVFLFNAGSAYSVKFFISSPELLKEPLGVIEVVFEADKAKIRQVTYLEEETSDLYKNILQALLRTPFILQETEDLEFLATMNITKYSDIKTMQLKKIKIGDEHNWLLYVSIIGKSESSEALEDKENKTLEFDLQPYTPKYWLGPKIIRQDYERCLFWPT